MCLLNAFQSCSLSVHQAFRRYKYPDPKNKKVKLNGKCLDSPETSTSDLTQTDSQYSSKGVLLKDPGEEMYVSRKKALARQTSLHSPVKVLDRWVLGAQRNGETDTVILFSLEVYETFKVVIYSVYKSECDWMKKINHLLYLQFDWAQAQPRPNFSRSHLRHSSGKWNLQFVSICIRSSPTA